MTTKKTVGTKRITKKLTQGTSFILAFIIALLNFSFTKAFADNSTTFQSDGFQVTYRITNEYGNTQNVQVTLKNLGEIENIWNASVTPNDDGTVSIKNAYHNADITPGTEVLYGYNLKNSTGKPVNFQRLYGRAPKNDGFSVSYNVLSDWGTGFSSNIQIKNDSTVPIMDWELTFDANAASLTAYNANISKTQDNKFVIIGAQGGYNIPAGGNVYISLGGTSASDSLSGFVLTESITDYVPNNTPEPPVNPPNEDGSFVKIINDGYGTEYKVSGLSEAVNDVTISKAESLSSQNLLAVYGNRYSVAPADVLRIDVPQDAGMVYIEAVFNEMPETILKVLDEDTFEWMPYFVDDETNAATIYTAESITFIPVCYAQTEIIEEFTETRQLRQSRAQVTDVPRHFEILENQNGHLRVRLSDLKNNFKSYKKALNPYSKVVMYADASKPPLRRLGNDIDNSVCVNSVLTCPKAEFTALRLRM
ncbi:MAG: cellulose binding domain-containing protein [Clostridiales bacterium]|jgi:hypothetical protein|nr:cellulose binding domain-containing protein [Clostridiales bacterium]